MSNALRTPDGALNLRGTVAVVTGAASGIGLALSRRLAFEGAHVVMADVSEARLAAAVDGLRALGLDVEGAITDVANEGAVNALAEQSFAAGRVSVVCLNAGIPGPLGEHTWKIPVTDWEPTIKVNLWGPVIGSTVFVRRLVEQGQPSHLFFTISMAGLFTSSVSAPYFATKHGVYALAAILRDQLSTTDVRVSAICPGAVQTPLLEAIRSDMRDATSRGALPEDRRVDPRRATLAPSQVAHAVADALGTTRFHVMLNPEYRHYYEEQFESVMAEWADIPPLESHYPAVERFLAAFESGERDDLRACFRDETAAYGLGGVPPSRLAETVRRLRFTYATNERPDGALEVHWTARDRRSGEAVARGIDVTTGDRLQIASIETSRALSLA